MYHTEDGDIAINENLKLKYFPIFLIGNVFMLFTILPLYFIFNWSQLQREFHERSYMGQSKIILKVLASMRREVGETIDD